MIYYSNICFLFYRSHIKIILVSKLNNNQKNSHNQSYYFIDCIFHKKIEIFYKCVKQILQLKIDFQKYL